MMDLASILMIAGIFFIVVSFFFRDKAKKVETDLEDLSINLYQETNSLKRRLKIVEEELMLEPNFQVASPKQNQVEPINVVTQVSATQTASQALPQSHTSTKPINSILVSQVIALNKQGLSIEEISKRSTLTASQIQSILSPGGRG